MKFLICSDYYPGLNGIAIYTENLSTALIEKGQEVEIASVLRIGEKRKEKIEGINVKRIREGEIKEFLKKAKGEYDWVIVRAFQFVSQIDFKLNNGIYVLPSLRSLTYKIMEREGQIIDKKIRKKGIKQEKMAMRNCKYLVYPSRSLKRQAEKEYGIKKGKVIPHGVNLKKFIPSNEKKFDVICVSNLNDKRKGIDKLIEVAKISDTRFIILGDGKLKKEYKKLVKKHKLRKKVLFLGRKPSEKYLPKSKIFILPSIYEGFGLVLLEAMASGLPCIAFKPDGKKILTASNEIIEQDKTGFLVKNEEEMAEKIDLLLENEKLRKKMSKNARKQAEKYSWEKTAEEILKLVREK